MSYSATAHLGDVGAALVDDQLEPMARELALVHLAGCDECRRDVEEQRQLKARLRALAGPGLPPGLASRLGALGTSGDPLSALPSASPAIPVRLPVGARTAVRPIGSRPPYGRPLGHTSIQRDSRRGRRILAGAASLLLVGAGTAFAAPGDIQSETPSRTVANTFSTRTTAVTTVGNQSVPLDDPAFAAMTASLRR